MKKRLVALCLLLAMLLTMALPVAAAEGPVPDVYTVLVLDASGSHDFYSGNTRIYTADTAAAEVKAASIDFSKALLGLGSEHHIAVVSYGRYGKIVSDFSQDIDVLTSRINGISTGGSESCVTDGLDKAQVLVKSVEDPLAVMNVVVFTTGLTISGSYTSSGKYNSSTVASHWVNRANNVNLYKYANSAIKSAETLSTYADIYTVGLFENWVGMPDAGKEVVTFFEMFTRDLAMEKKTPAPENYNPAYSRAQIQEAFKQVCNGIINNDFKDVTYNNFYFYPVIWAIENGVTQGVTLNSFEPMATCTREQMVTFLWRAAGSPAPTNTQWTFTDSCSNYSRDAILWAVEQGITKGMPDGTFAAYDHVTREQVVTFLYRYDGQKTPNNTDTPFTDLTAKYSRNAIAWASENSITKGITSTTFCPSDPCTRGQIVTFMYRYFVNYLAP